jgi:cytoskeletal protein CcmA (bactofilin family)
VFGRRKRKEPEPEPEPIALPVATGASALPLPDASLDVSIEILDVAPDALPPHTILAEDTRVVGSLQTASQLVVEGEIEGEVTSSDMVVVGRDAAIKGNVSAQNLEVDGRIEGEVRTRRLHVGSTGGVHGDVVVERLAVDEGGVLEGRCGMKR